MTEEQIEKLAEELSEEDLNALAGGKELSPKAKEALKWVGVGLGTAAGAATVGTGIVALIGWQKGIGPLKMLNKNSSADSPSGSSRTTVELLQLGGTQPQSPPSDE